MSSSATHTDHNIVKFQAAQTPSALYFEDMVLGLLLTSAQHVVDGDELVAFAKIWDPLPIHVDEQAGKEAFGSLTGPGVYILAVKQRLIHQLPQMMVIASLGYDEVRFHAPIRPVDTVHVQMQVMAQRVSESKPDRGVVTLKFSLINQDGLAVMSHLDTVLVKRRIL